MLEKNEKNRIG